MELYMLSPALDISSL